MIYLSSKRTTGGMYDFVDDDEEQKDSLKKTFGKTVKTGPVRRRPEKQTREEPFFEVTETIIVEPNFLKKHWALIAVVIVAIILGVMNGTGFFTIPWYIIFVLYLVYVIMIKKK